MDASNLKISSHRPSCVHNLDTKARIYSGICRGGNFQPFVKFFWLHSFQKETQGTSGKDIGTAGERRIGGNFPDLFQHASVLFGHLMPCERKDGAKSS